MKVPLVGADLFHVDGRTDRHDETKKELGDWLTVHHSITLADLQLDAQNYIVHQVGDQPRL
jgi:hypothetical protein